MADNYLAAASFLNAYATGQAQKAAAINQETGFLLQAADSVALADVRAQFSEQYANIQAGRMLKRAEIEARNYEIAGNTLLSNMRKTNAAIRARAAASGVVVGEGSFQAVQQQNVQNTMFDVGIADLNALTARVLGFEDATAMIQSTELQNTLDLFAAKRQAGQYSQAASAARRQGGLLETAALVQGGIDAYKAYRTDMPTGKAPPPGSKTTTRFVP